MSQKMSPIPHGVVRRFRASSRLLTGVALLLWVPASVSCRSGQTPPNAQAARETDDPAADEAMVDGRWRESIERHRALLERDPGNGLAMYHLGFSAGSLERHREEVEWYERAIGAGYRSPDLLYNLGLARLELGELSAAESALAEALEAKPDEAEFHYAAARVALAQENEGAAARAHLERATELDPGHREAWAALAALYEEQGDLEAAEVARARSR
jgi:tetratricopeptide (TPR) repeat protein